MNERFAEVLDEAALLRDLDAARAEVWVSGLLGEWADLDDLLVLLGASVRPEALAGARAATTMRPEAGAIATALAARGIDEPPWLADVGTAVAHQAWEIVDPFSGNVSVVVEYEHADAVRHSMLVEIEEGAAVDINFGPPGLVDDAFGESDTRSLSVQDSPVDRALERIAVALERTARDGEVSVTDEFVMNVALARARVSGFARVEVGSATVVVPPVVAASVHPLARPVRDAFEIEADAASCITLRAALARELAEGAPIEALTLAADRVRHALAVGSSPDLDALAAEADVGESVASFDDAMLLARLAGTFVVPGPLDAFSPAARDAIRGLEWADWLGAVIPLVRAGIGADADPLQLVRNINRCPEVTTTVPKRDAPAVADVFARTLHAWELTGVLDLDGRLTALGVWILPRSLLVAWGASANDQG